MLQNKKYIKFAHENTVEVISLGRLQEGIDTQDRKAETYAGEDGKSYLVEFPGMTVEQMLALNRSKAATYNNTGKIPYTSVVNPHTLEEVSNIKGGYGAKKLMELVLEAKRQLNKEHGPSLSRKDLDKFEKDARKVRALHEKDKLPQALDSARKLQAKYAGEHEVFQQRAKALLDELLAAARAQLDEAEGLIGRGAAKDAQKILSRLARPLAGTDLEARVNDLLAKTKTG